MLVAPYNMTIFKKNATQVTRLLRTPFNQKKNNLLYFVLFTYFVIVFVINGTSHKISE